MLEQLKNYLKSNNIKIPVEVSDEIFHFEESYSEMETKVTYLESQILDLKGMLGKEKYFADRFEQEASSIALSYEKLCDFVEELNLIEGKGGKGNFNAKMVLNNLENLK